MTSRIEIKREETHFRILRLLQENSNLTQREIADAAGISLGALNYCLKALVNKGQIKIRNFRSSSRKIAYAYLLTPSGIARKVELTRRFLKRKMDEYEQLKAEIEILQRETAEAHNKKRLRSMGVGEGMGRGKHELAR